MNRLLSAALLFLIAVPASAALAAEASPVCPPALLATLGHELKVAHFAVGVDNFGKDPDGVLIAMSCKRMPDDPRLTLVAAAWDAHEADSKALAIAIVDESTSVVVALKRDEIDEDAAMQVNASSLRLDTAPYELAPGVRAFGLDIVSENRSCGEGGEGPSRTLYVREGRTLRPVLQGLTINTGGTTSTATLYDGTSTAGTKLATVATTALGSLTFNAAFTVGLFAVLAGGAAADVTVTFR